jgi:hypothetical protein
VRRIEGEVIEHLFAVGSGQTAIVGPRQTTTLVLSGVANDLPTKLDHRIRFRIAGDDRKSEAARKQRQTRRQQAA